MCIRDSPWDIAQTFETLSNFPIEEAYELQNAINNKDIKNIKEELGDLLLQVVLFSQVGKDNNMFSFEEVCNEITKKINWCDFSDCDDYFSNSSNRSRNQSMDN